MFFNALRVYSLTEAIQGNVSAKLAEMPFHPCQSLDPVRAGFVPPVPGGTDYIHMVNGCALICLKRQEKILPSAAIKEALDAKVQVVQESESRPVGRKDRTTLKDEIIFSMLPHALTRSTLTYGYVDTTNGRIIVGQRRVPTAPRCS